MPGMVADIIRGAKDMTDAEILTIYAKVSGKYAVYLTDDRVMVQYADDDALGVEQRTNIRPLSALRTEIDALKDGWDDGGFGFARARRNARAEGLNHLTADALIRALQGDPTGAIVAITAVRDDLLAERTSIGRLEYLLAAAVAGFVAIILLALLSIMPFGGTTDYMNKNATLMAISLGILGSLFSISLGIRSRSVGSDLHMRDNLVDSVLRIVIGAVSAFILFALLKGGAISLSIGGTPLVPDFKTEEGIAIAVIVAFLAGFSEMLVGDFLGTVAASGKSGTGSAPSVESPTNALKTENNPTGRGTSDSAPVAVLSLPEDTDDSSDGGGETPIAPDDATDDSELPPATGGVEATDRFRSGNPQ